MLELESQGCKRLAAQDADKSVLCLIVRVLEVEGEGGVGAIHVGAKRTLVSKLKINKNIQAQNQGKVQKRIAKSNDWRTDELKN